MQYILKESGVLIKVIQECATDIIITIIINFATNFKKLFWKSGTCFALLKHQNFLGKML